MCSVGVGRLFVKLRFSDSTDNALEQGVNEQLR